MPRHPAARLGEGSALVDDYRRGLGGCEGGEQHRHERKRRLERPRRASARARRLDRPPARPQALGVGGKIRRRGAARRGAQHEALAGPGDLAQHRAKPLALGRRDALPCGNASPSWCEVEEAAGKTQPGRHAHGLVGARLLGHLNGDRFAFVERDDASTRRGVLGAEESGAVEADIDQRCRQLRLERDDATEDHFADAAHACAGAEDAQLPQRLVLEQRRPQLAGRCGDEQRAAHRPGGASRRARSKPWPARRLTVSNSGRPTTLE